MVLLVDQASIAQKYKVKISGKGHKIIIDR